MGLYIWQGAGRLTWGKRITLKNDFSCIWQVGMSCRWRKAILQYQKGTFPIVLIARCWQHALTSPSSLAPKQGELCSRAEEPQTIICISPEGLVTQGLWCNIQTPKGDTLPCKGMALGKVLGQMKWSVPLPSGKGLTRTRIIS